jgi:hypothetical protein
MELLGANQPELEGMVIFLASKASDSVTIKPFILIGAGTV